MTEPTIPVTNSVADLVSRHLYKSGPMTEADLYLAVDFGVAPSKRYTRLSHAISTGWIAQIDGHLVCSPTARAHYDALDGTPEEVKPIGQIATARQMPNVFERPSLNKRHIPSTRGMREVPAWSVRPDGFSVKSANGEKA